MYNDVQHKCSNLATYDYASRRDFFHSPLEHLFCILNATDA